MSIDGSASDIDSSFELLLDTIRDIVADVPQEIVERVRRDGLDHQLTDVDRRRLLGRLVDAIVEDAYQRGDGATVNRLQSEKESIVSTVAERSQSPSHASAHVHSPTTTLVKLRPHNGSEPHPVRPTPTFHGRQIPMRTGFVDVTHINLWGNNERLTIHVNQFQKVFGRAPSATELLDIMRSEANLAVPGLDGKDQFKIRDLAGSIAANGVRVPPVIDLDGTLLDGNRRVAACLHVLHDPDFTREQKARAKTIRVWQLTEDAGPDDANAVVVSLNFEPDLKEEWPEYVKARKVFEQWRAMLELHPGSSAAKQRQLKQELARIFGINTQRANRYIGMVELADEFEDYQRNERGRDEYEVQHAADRYFQYFDELGRGQNPGGVNYAMNHDDSFRSLVFDLLHDGKFRRWAQIRDLRYAYEDEEAMDFLTSARAEKDIDRAQEFVDNGLSAGRMARAVERRVGGNKRIESFVRWLREAPMEFFSVGQPGAITRANLRRLYEALRLVEAHVPGDVRREVDGS